MSKKFIESHAVYQKAKVVFTIYYKLHDSLLTQPAFSFGTTCDGGAGYSGVL